MLVKNRAGQLLDFAQRVYPFAFSLLNDEVPAYQLVVDSLTRMELDEGEEISFLNLCGRCYELAKKSTLPLAKSPEGIFGQLSLEEKSILFLKEKEGMSVEEIAKALNTTTVKIHAVLTTARNNFFELAGIH